MTEPTSTSQVPDDVKEALSKLLLNLHSNIYADPKFVDESIVYYEPTSPTNRPITYTAYVRFAFTDSTLTDMIKFKYHRRYGTDLTVIHIWELA